MRGTIRRTVLAAPAAAALLIAACTAAPPPEQPRQQFSPSPSLSLRNTEQRLISFETAELLFHLRADNPTSRPLLLRELSYTLEPEGNNPLEGKRSLSGTEVPAGGSIPLELPVRLPLSPPQSAAPTRDADLPYRIEVTVQGERAGGEPLRLTAAGEGKVTTGQLPRLSIRKVVIPQFETRIIRLRYEVTVENPNPFAVEVSPPQYVFSVEERRWDAGTFPHSLAIAPGEEQTVGLPMTVNYLEAGRHTVDILVSAKVLDYRLWGTAAVRPHSGDKTRSAGTAYRFSFDTAGTAAIIRP